MALREKGAITGVGETAYSRESGRSVLSLQLEAASPTTRSRTGSGRSATITGRRSCSTSTMSLTASTYAATCTQRARYCVVTAGNLSTPRVPNFKGIHDFKGKWYHPAC